MVRFLFFILLLAAQAAALAQTADTSFWHQQWQQRIKLDKTHGSVLGGWGLANVATGIVGANTSGGSHRYFHQMNVGWGVINTGLAYFIRRQVPKDQAKAPNPAMVRMAQQRVESLLLLNTGLDLAYVAVGWGVKQRANNMAAGKSRDRALGFGESWMVQGGFLLVFDVWQYVRHRRQGKAIAQHDEKQWTLQPVGNGVGLVYRW
jgi:hypothetical protein